MNTESSSLTKQTSLGGASGAAPADKRFYYIAHRKARGFMERPVGDGHIEAPSAAEARSLLAYRYQTTPARITLKLES